jgi:hypothetical protein
MTGHTYVDSGESEQHERNNREPFDKISNPGGEVNFLNHDNVTDSHPTSKTILISQKFLLHEDLMRHLNSHSSRSSPVQKLGLLTLLVWFEY